MKSATRIAALVCIVLGMLLPVSAATASTATPRPGTSTGAAQQVPVSCNQPRSHDKEGNRAETAGSDGLVRCAIRVLPQRAKAVPNASAADPAADDKIDFCNTTGGIIGCFNVMLHFVSATEFQLYDIEVSDDLADGRSVYADVDTQAVDFGTFGDTDGSGTTAYDDTSVYDFTDSLDGVQYVYIDLYACGNIFSGCSSDAFSAAQVNPLDAASAANRPAISAKARAVHHKPGTVKLLNANWHLWAMTAAQRNQVGLDRAAAAIDGLIKRDGMSGYGGLIVSSARNSLTVYWKGQVPAALEHYAAGKHPGGAIRFASAAYSQTQLDSLRASILNSSGFRHSGITMIAPAPDGSGLQVGVATTPAQARSLPAIAHSATRVTYTRQPATVPASGRWADIPSFFGGAIISQPGMDCSSGWPVHSTASPTTYYMITAAHCVYPLSPTPLGNIWTTSPATSIPVKNVGTATKYDLTEDAGLINLDANGSPFGGDGNAIYTGLVDPTGVSGFGEMSAGIDGTLTNQDGDTDVCTSGAYSGEICGLTIENTQAAWTITYNDGTEVIIIGLQIQNPNKTNAAGQGDSGGPVYSYVNAGLVAARGIISAIGVASGQTTGCTGVLYFRNDPNNSARICSSVVFAPDINQILSDPLLPGTALNNEP
jgi:hypothetical protein